MRHSNRSILSTALAAALVAALLPLDASAYTSEELKCRATVSKNGGKYAKSALKAMSGCHKNRDKDGAFSLTDCNDITAADPDNKVAAAASKLESGVVSKCVGVVPDEVLYDSCPPPCDVEVPAIVTFDDVAECVVCLTDNSTESFSDQANGTPTSPLTEKADAACHGAITKNTSKFFNSVLKLVGKCQASWEKGGDETLTTCTTDPNFQLLIDDAEDKCRVGVAGKCAETTLPGSTLDACGGSATPETLAACVCDAAEDEAQALATEYLQLVAPTTTTTLPLGDPACPDLGEVTLFSRDSQVACSDNNDCTAPRTCDTTVGLCKTLTALDSGWNGIGHNADINDGVLAMAHLYCPGPAGPTCGQCDVVGLDPTPGNCRCANSVRTICDQPFNQNANDCKTCEGGSATAGKACAVDADCNVGTCVGRCATNLSLTCAVNADCTGFGTCSTFNADPTKKNKCANGAFCSANTDCQGECSDLDTCECFLGAPFPLNSGGTAACVVSRFAKNISGTADVDLGAGEITANLRSRVYLGITGQKPCPVCAGKCSDNNATCTFDSECTSNDCVQDIPNDGIRNGVCSGGLHTNQSCDAGGSNATFPAIVGGALPAGGQYSIDCQPSTGLNVSGVGLQIDLNQSTGTTSLTAGVDCDGSGVGTALCPCLQCSKDKSIPCDSDGDCTAQGTFCDGYNDPVTFACSTNADCTSVDLGSCTANGGTTCSDALGKACTNDSDCNNQPAGNCVVSTCSSPGIGILPSPNGCSDGVCDNQGGGRGLCATGPDDGYCDGLLRVDGRGMKTCSNNSDCGLLGNCTLTERRSYYLDPIVATGDEDPDFPVAGAVFCIPPTENGGINVAVGLPGPGRITNQGSARTFCASDHNTEYTPGAGLCPP